MAKINLFRDWEDFNTVYITGGHFTMQGIKEICPDMKYDDQDIKEIEKYGYMRHEFTGDDEIPHGWVWYDSNHSKELKGAVTKATRVHVEG